MGGGGGGLGGGGWGGVGWENKLMMHGVDVVVGGWDARSSFPGTSRPSPHRALRAGPNRETIC